MLQRAHDVPAGASAAAGAGPGLREDTAQSVLFGSVRSALGLRDAWAGDEQAVACFDGGKLMSGASPDAQPLPILGAQGERPSTSWGPT